MKAKLLKILILSIVLISAIIPNVQADDSIFAGAEDFISKGAEQAGSRGESEAAGAVNTIGAIMVNIAGYILVIGVIVVGIKYMMANPEGKAKLKGQLIGLAVATIVIYGAQFIWSTVISVFPD